MVSLVVLTGKVGVIRDALGHTAQSTALSALRSSNVRIRLSSLPIGLAMRYLTKYSKTYV